jgi:hypothetical protein
VVRWPPLRTRPERRELGTRREGMHLCEPLMPRSDLSQRPARVSGRTSRGLVGAFVPDEGFGIIVAVLHPGGDGRLDEVEPRALGDVVNDGALNCGAISDSGHWPLVVVVSVTPPRGVTPDLARMKPFPLPRVHFMPVVVERQVNGPRVMEVP